MIEQMSLLSIWSSQCCRTYFNHQRAEQSPAPPTKACIHSSSSPMQMHTDRQVSALAGTHWCDCADCYNIEMLLYQEVNNHYLQCLSFDPSPSHENHPTPDHPTVYYLKGATWPNKAPAVELWSTSFLLIQCLCPASCEIFFNIIHADKYIEYKHTGEEKELSDEMEICQVDYTNTVSEQINCLNRPAYLKHEHI